MTADEDEFAPGSLRDWALKHQFDVLFQNRWMGVPVAKSPLDLWIYQEILHEVRPDVVVEIGGWNGGSALWFADTLGLLGGGTVVSVEIDRSAWVTDDERIVQVTGDSGSSEVREQVSEACADGSVLVCHDGDHRCEPVLADLRAYADLVTPGSYLIVEDGIIDMYPPGTGIHPDSIDAGPLPAIELFLKEDSRFVVDSSRERFGLTWNPRGYLRRTE